ncbi:MAG: hypothetical protein Q4F24_16265 [Eubacteriales bacterium]|nr:hypothetical protein [Eubacteriales bacterium]
MKKKRKCCMLLILMLLFGSAQTIWADAAVDWYSQEAVDYDVQVSAPDGGVNIRYGPGVEYDRLMDSMIPNGVILHVTSQAQASNGNYWGYTYYNGIYGWIALTQVSRIESVPTPAPATPEPVQLPSETPVVTAAPTEAVTPLVTEIPTVTPTAEPTETPSETKEPEKTPAPEEESKEEGITISYRLLIKILIGVCIVLIVLFTAIVLLLISKKR